MKVEKEILEFSNKVLDNFDPERVKEKELSKL